MHLTERKDSQRAFYDNASLNKTYEGNEESDAPGNTMLQAIRNGIDDHFADSQKGKDNEYNTRYKNRTKRCLPCETQREDGRNEKEILTHSRCECNGIISINTHNERCNEC